MHEMSAPVSKKSYIASRFKKHFDFAAVGKYNLRCDLDPDHSNPIFSQGTPLRMLLIHQGHGAKYNC